MGEDNKILIECIEQDLRNQIVNDIKAAPADFVFCESAQERNSLLGEDDFRILIIIKELDQQLVDEISQLKENLIEEGHIVILANDCRDYADFLYKAGISGLIERPHRPNELYALVTRLLIDSEDAIVDKGRRSNVRLPIEYKFSHGSELKKGVVTNLAKGGVFIIEEHELPRTGSLISFSIAVDNGPGPGSEVVTGNAIVRWIREESSDEGPQGFGVEFIGIAENSLPIYLELVKQVRRSASTG